MGFGPYHREKLGRSSGMSIMEIVVGMGIFAGVMAASTSFFKVATRESGQRRVLVTRDQLVATLRKTLSVPAAIRDSGYGDQSRNAALFGCIDRAGTNDCTTYTGSGLGVGFFLKDPLRGVDIAGPAATPICYDVAGKDLSCTAPGALYQVSTYVKATCPPQANLRPQAQCALSDALTLSYEIKPVAGRAPAAQSSSLTESFTLSTALVTSLAPALTPLTPGCGNMGRKLSRPLPDCSGATSLPAYDPTGVAGCNPNLEIARVAGNASGGKCYDQYASCNPTLISRTANVTLNSTQIDWTWSSTGHPNPNCQAPASGGQPGVLYWECCPIPATTPVTTTPGPTTPPPTSPSGCMNGNPCVSDSQCGGGTCQPFSYRVCECEQFMCNGQGGSSYSGPGGCWGSDSCTQDSDCPADNGSNIGSQSCVPNVDPAYGWQTWGCGPSRSGQACDCSIPAPTTPAPTTPAPTTPASTTPSMNCQMVHNPSYPGSDLTGSNLCGPSPYDYFATDAGSGAVCNDVNGSPSGCPNSFNTGCNRILFQSGIAYLDNGNPCTCRDSGCTPSYVFSQICCDAPPSPPYPVTTTPGAPMPTTPMPTTPPPTTPTCQPPGMNGCVFLPPLAGSANMGMTYDGPSAHADCAQNEPASLMSSPGCNLCKSYGPCCAAVFQMIVEPASWNSFVSSKSWSGGSGAPCAN